MKLRAYTGCFIACLLSIAACDSAPPPSSGGKGIHGGVAATGGGAVPGAPNGTGGVPGATSGSNAVPSGGGVGGGAVGGSSGNLPMGGSSGASNGGSSPGTGAMGGSAAPSNPLDKGNYFQSGAWMGYVWTSANGAGSTIAPKDFAAQTTGMPRCVKGSVAATTDFSGTAILGVNLSEGSGVTSMTVTPSKEGVLLDISNNAKSPLRFQIKSSTSGGTEWCTPITGSGFVPWSSLRTKCWDTTGTQYKREPIAAAMILVPGTDTAAVAFDFCLNSLVEADAPPGGSAGSGGTGAAGSSAGSGGMSGGSGSGGMSGNVSGGTGGTSVPPLQNGCAGFATRFWDCCKPHCGWSSNAPTGPLASCDRSDNSLGGNYDAANSCEGGPAFLCHSNAPWAVSDQLSYGYTAVAARAGSDICGKCYQLQFTGNSHNGAGDPGSSMLAGKTMIVQAINIGGDVGSGQFDIAIPGGGVGAFNACSSQWSVSASQLGPNYGGFLAACKQQGISDLAGIKSCVMQKCAMFSDKGLTELADGCKWFVDWFQAADNPSLEYAEVPCPSDLQNRGLRRSGGGGGSCLR